MFGQGCPKFVPLIEGEKFGSPELKAAIHEYADKLREHNVDTVLLSCTHYPFVRKEIEEEFGPEVTILDPAERTTQDALENLEKQGLARTTGLGRAEICFTADLNGAETGCPDAGPEQVRIPSDRSPEGSGTARTGRPDGVKTLDSRGWAMGQGWISLRKIWNFRKIRL